MEEQETLKLFEAKRRLASEHVLLPDLEMQIETTVAALCWKFESTGETSLGLVAKLSSLRELRDNLKTKGRLAEKTVHDLERE